MDGLPPGYDDWKLASPPENEREPGEEPPDPDDVGSDFECTECGEDLDEDGSCTNEDCAEYDAEEEEA